MYGNPGEASIKCGFNESDGAVLRCGLPRCLVAPHGPSPFARVSLSHFQVDPVRAHVPSPICNQVGRATGMPSFELVETGIAMILPTDNDNQHSLRSGIWRLSMREMV